MSLWKAIDKRDKQRISTFLSCVGILRLNCTETFRSFVEPRLRCLCAEMHCHAIWAVGVRAEGLAFACADRKLNPVEK